ncbi:hypothetical protein [Streptomyces violaceusniger]|uniref:hypothetical protein n=1 Tax=Streptomyces violaceusniger TaxID=68280 RepID=UPI0002D50E23|nr:hypothetical protein [Streptomyces violaceusniger]
MPRPLDDTDGDAYFSTPSPNALRDPATGHPPPQFESVISQGCDADVLSQASVGNTSA